MCHLSPGCPSPTQCPQAAKPELAAGSVSNHIQSLGSFLLLGLRQLDKEKYLDYLFCFITTESKWIMYNDTVPPQRGRWQFMLIPLPFSWCLLIFEGLTKSTKWQPEKTHHGSGAISTASKNTLQRMKDIIPIWKKKMAKHQDKPYTSHSELLTALYTTQLPHVVMQPLHTMAPDVCCFSAPAECPAVMAGHWEGQGPLWHSDRVM